MCVSWKKCPRYSDVKLNNLLRPVLLNLFVVEGRVNEFVETPVLRYPEWWLSESGFW